MAGGDPDTPTCNLAGRNTSNPLHIQANFGGIPQQLALNSILLAILLLLFVVLRKSAWKVLNRIVNKDDVNRWTELFFSFAQSADDEPQKEEEEKKKKKVENGDASQKRDRAGEEEGGEGEAADEQGTDQPLRRHDSQPEGQEDLILGAEPSPKDAEEGTASAADADAAGDAGDAAKSRLSPVPSSGRQSRLSRSNTLTDSGTFWQWLKSIFTTSDDELEWRCGHDALQYVRFQRHLIFYLMIVAVICVGVIVPLNFQGDLKGLKNETSFGHTTIANLDPTSDLLWFHICFSFFFFPLAIVFMRKFSVGVGFVKAGLELSKTVLIDGVPKYLCREEEIRRYFEEAFPDAEIKHVEFAYNVDKLNGLHQELVSYRSAKEYCEHNQALGREGFDMYPTHCSRFCGPCCCLCSTKVEALDYYFEEEARLQSDFEKEKEVSLRTPLGIVFVSFKSVNMAKDVYDAFKRYFFQCSFEAPHSSLSSILKPHRWKVSFAPTPDDIYWENLSTNRRFLLIKKISVNLLLFFVTFLFSTPEVAASQVEFLLQFFGKNLQLPSWIQDFLPTLMLWGFTALLPLLVVWSDRFLGHWTRSTENHNIMKKVFWYSMFLVIILPTFGFTTVSAGLTFLLDQGSNKSEKYRWDCVFLPDSGAFFVNYLITTAMVGIGLELIRFPEMFFYLMQSCWSRSPADTPAIRRKLKAEFRFGEQYAKMMMLFCMIMMFSVSCPVITPFGVLYFVNKHYVDRHNLLYAYKPSKINKRVHSTAIGFVILSILFTQFFMSIFIVIRNAGEESIFTWKAKVSLGLLFLSFNIFSAQLWQDTCKKFSPIEYRENTYIREDEEELAKQDLIYLPDILKSEDHKREQSVRRSLRLSRSPEAYEPVERQDSGGGGGGGGDRGGAHSYSSDEEGRDPRAPPGALPRPPTTSTTVTSPDENTVQWAGLAADPKS